MLPMTMAAQIPIESPMTLMVEKSLFFRMPLQAIFRLFWNICLLFYSARKLFTGLDLAAFMA